MEERMKNVLKVIVKSENKLILRHFFQFFNTKSICIKLNLIR